MDIHLGFEPDAARARSIDRRMHLELADSLRYVIQEARDELPMNEDLILSLVNRIESGERVSAEVFACYYDLVATLMDADLENSVRLIERIQSSQSSHQGRSFRRLQSPRHCPVSALYLEKFLEGSECAVLPPSLETVDQFCGRFERGLNLLKKAAPELAGEVEAIVHEVIPIMGDPSKKMQIDGGSHYQLWGALFLNAGFHPSDEAMAEVIAHESAHSLLFGLCTHETLVQNDDDEGYPSPLREDLRPMDGIYHATFVSARMHWAMNRLLEAGLVQAQRRDEVVKARDLDRINFESGLSVVRQYGQLTALGQEVMAGAERYMAHSA